MAFNRATRQRIIDGYLAATGRNMFVASEFVDWLADQPEHEAYPLIYAKDDESAAREFRIDLARRMASGLRITVTRSNMDSAKVVHITTREYPAYVSPMSGRRSGGGYGRFDPDDAEAIAELMRQGATALRGWLARYRGAFEASGFDMAAIEELASSQDAGEAESA